DRGIEPLPWSGTLPGGLLLGRSADGDGFLVEFPRADGSRAIGRVAWADGRLSWMADEESAVCAHATLLPGGGLAYCRRPADAADFVLVLRDPAGSEDRVLAFPGAALLFPLVGGASAVAVIRQTPAGLELVGLGGVTGARTPEVIAATPLAGAPDPYLAYQATLGFQTPLSGDPEQAGSGAVGTGGGRSVLVLVPGSGAITEFNPVTGVLRPLVAGGAGGCAAPGGYLVGAPGSLVRVRTDAGVVPQEPGPPRLTTIWPILRGAYVPRATDQPGRFVLLGQAPAGGQPALQVLRLALVSGREESPGMDLENRRNSR
ncbi:MAG TPA: hypothetical protein VD963_06300, partial [Phycisphaerales bacterium]|nr:hypothetical protein [Phycisphaerales bacterium]